MGSYAAFYGWVFLGTFGTRKHPICLDGLLGVTRSGVTSSGHTGSVHLFNAAVQTSCPRHVGKRVPALCPPGVPSSGTAVGSKQTV